MNPQKMMKQLQKMQEDMARKQQELEKRTVEATAGGGKVTVVATGAGDIVSIKISKEVVDPEDVEFLEDLVLTATRKAIEDSRALVQKEMGSLTGGLGIPGLGM
jgi:DNA-binding YbaB/EbfC family protein